MPAPVDLVLLGNAARIVYAEVFHTDAAVSQERLAGLAQAMAALVPIYVREPTGPRRLSPEELAGAIVRGGGTELHFGDGRPALRQLHVSRTGMDHVIGLLGAGPLAASAAPKTGVFSTA